MQRSIRTWPPWRKFRPGVWHNDEGKEWHIFLSGEQAYTERRTIEVDAHICEETGRIVGFDVWDSTLAVDKPPP